jgi:hypothetical protein
MSMNWADVYGLPSDLAVAVQPTSVAGPNQGSVVNPAGTQAPSQNAGVAAPTIAFSWVGIILLLIGLRLLYEMAER